MEIVYGDISWASAVDGPGTRVVLYVRGCELRCPWCHSPHLRDPNFCLLFFASRCRLCGACVAACPHGVHRIQNGEHQLDRSRCRQCGRCLGACPTAIPGRALAGALAIPVFRAGPEELFRRLRPQLDLVRRIGGLTVCGGEPVLQYRALRELLTLCRRARIHTAVETSGSVPSRSIAVLADVVDCWLLGIRPVSSAICDARLVARLEVVQRNLAFLAARSAASIIVRTPIIPGLTDAPESLALIADTMRTNGLSALEALPMNPHTSHYYDAMGQPFPLSGVRPPTENEVSTIRRFFCDRGIETRVVP